MNIKTDIKEDILKLADLCVEIEDKLKAEDIVRVDLRQISIIADYMILCTAISEPHLKAISEHIIRDIRNLTGIHAITVDGTPESGWIVIDFGAVIVHIMNTEKRELYQLENLWADGVIHKYNE